MEEKDLDVRISQLEQRLAEARARLPRHSVRPAQMIEIEELEEELERLRAQRDEGLQSAPWCQCGSDSNR